MFGDARVGEQAPDVVGPSRGRLAGGVAIVLIVLLVVVGSQIYDRLASDYPQGMCKSVGWGGSINSDEPVEPLPRTAEAAIAQMAQGGASPMGVHPFPSDGWHEYRGRWVREGANDVYSADGYYELGLSETARGWSVESFSICGR